MDLLISLPGLFLAIIFHELAHGYMAYILGDKTAKEAGRLTLNPIKHMDPIGFIFMLSFKFGWAKPVPINSRNFKNRNLGIFLVSLAGPLMNFLLALILGLIISMSVISKEVIMNMLLMALWYNLMLGVFNLLPFPPLDGSKILVSILPLKLQNYFYKYEDYLRIILLILLMTNYIDRLLSPLISGAMNLLINIIF